MKILVINGSHRSKQTTYGLAEKFAGKIKSKNVDVEICELANLNIQGCCATSACVKTPEKRCVHNNDDFNMLFDKIAQSDALLVLVPKYGPYPSKVVAVVERLMAISWWGYGQHKKINEFVLAGKPAAMVAYTTSPGIPIEVFFPLFFTFAELGFDMLKFKNKFRNLPGMYFNVSKGESDKMMDTVAQSFKKKLNIQ